MSNLLAQGKEIKRLKKDDERRQREMEEVELERGEEEKERTIAQFEKTMMGLEGGEKKKNNGTSGISEEIRGRDREGKGVKRKFELDEEEMLKNAKEERAKARKVLEEEKVQLTPLIPYNSLHDQLTFPSQPKQHSPHSGSHPSRHPPPPLTHKQTKS